MCPTCAMRWCWARFGGAHRESSQTPSVNTPAPASWILHRVAFGLRCGQTSGQLSAGFQTLVQVIPDEKSHLGY